MNQTQRLGNRVKKIHESLKADNKKAANKLGLQLIKEFPESQYAKVVWGEVLIAQNRTAEAQKIAEEVVNSRPNDPKVLSTLSSLLKRLGQDQQMVTLSKQGWESHQNDIAASQWFGHELFTAYVRQGDIVSQKKFSMELFKKFKEDKYIVWNIVITALESRSADATKAAVLNTLATKMFENHFAKAENPKQQEVLFFMNMLLNQNNGARALEIVSGEIGKKAFKIKSQQLDHVAQLHLKLQQWDKAFQVFTELLMNHGDDWNWFSNFIHSLFQLVEADTKNKDILLKQAADVINFNKKKFPMGRGAYLAECEIQLRLNNENELVSHLVTYFTRFGSKPCAFRDMRPYLIHLKDKGKEIVHLLEATLPKREESENVRSWCESRMSLEQIKRALLGSCYSPDQCLTEAKAMFLLYEWASQLPGESERLKTDHGIGDSFALLSSHYLLDHWSQTSSSSSLMEAILVLEYALLHSPSNHTFKLLLLRLYGHVGALQRVHEIWEPMDIKHIQNESMSHLVLADFLRFLGYVQAQKIIKDVLKFHQDWDIRAPHNIVEAYLKESYAMVNEFLEFKEQLSSSLQLAVVQTESINLQLAQRGHTIEEISKILEGFPLDRLVTQEEATKKLTDNCDWKLISRFDLDPEVPRGWEWPQLVCEEATNCAHSQKSYMGECEDKQRQLLRLRNIQLLLLNALVNKKLPEIVHLQLYREVLDKLGNIKTEQDIYDPDFLQKQNPNFDSSNALLIFVTYDMYSSINSCSEEIKEGTDKADLFYSKVESALSLLGNLIKHISSTHIIPYSLLLNQDITQNIHAGSKLPYFITFLTSLQHVNVAVQVYIDLVPKRLKKTASSATKDLHGQFKKILRDFLNVLKEFFSEQQIHLEASLMEQSPTKLLHEQQTIIEFSRKEEISSTISAICNNMVAAKKITLNRIIEFLREKSRPLKQIKI